MPRYQDYINRIRQNHDRAALLDLFSKFLNSSDPITVKVEAIASEATANIIEISEDTAITERLVIPKGTIYQIATGVTLTFTGPQPEIGDYQAFSCVGTGAVAGLKEAKPEWFDDNATPGTTDMAGAIQTAVDAVDSGGKVKLSSAVYLVGSQISTTDGAPVLLQGNGYMTQLKKGFDGDLISLGKLSQLQDLYIEGDGANFTGGGVVISTGALDNISWRRIQNVDILGTEDSGLIFEGNRAGYASQVSNSRIVPYDTLTDSATPAIKLPTLGEVESNGNRQFVNVWSYANPLIDFADSNNTILSGCQGGFPIFSSSNVAKALVVGGRLVIPTTGSSVKGTSTVIVGNSINASGELGLTFESTLAQSEFIGNAVGSGIPITDNSTGLAGGNRIEIPETSYTPTWTGASGNPAIENGTLSGSWKRTGQSCKVNISLVVGSETTFGTGTWSFSVPYTSARYSTGSVFIFDSGTRYYVGIAVIDASTSVVYIVPEGSNLVNASTPMTWAVEDQMYLDIEYIIA